VADPIRLNKFIAQHLSVGRRAADDLITQGKVQLNGEVPSLGARVNTGDHVMVNGIRLQNTDAPEFLYVLFNKPVGYVCSRRQQGDTPTIYSVLPPQYQHLKPVGRLDKDSSGLLVLTNDGDFAHHMTHPRFIKTKVYEVTLDQPLAPLHHQMIADHGVILADGPSKFQLSRLEEGNPFRWIVTMHEGRNRQIRRTFDALGYRVIALNRVQFGPFTLNQLGGKQFSEVTDPHLLD
jgi:23S rRNA pseudouridine2605 synthase